MSGLVAWVGIKSNGFASNALDLANRNFNHVVWRHPKPQPGRPATTRTSTRSTTNLKNCNQVEKNRNHVVGQQNFNRVPVLVAEYSAKSNGFAGNALELSARSATGSTACGQNLNRVGRLGPKSQPCRLGSCLRAGGPRGRLLSCRTCPKRLPGSSSGPLKPTPLAGAPRSLRATGFVRLSAKYSALRKMTPLPPYAHTCIDSSNGQ